MFPRVVKLAGIMGVSTREAMGTVALLWRESQDVLAITGKPGEIIDWAHLFDLTHDEQQDWISALERSRLISATDDGQYRIHGNDHQIEHIVSKMKSSAKGGAATKAKWAAVKQANEGRVKAERLADTTQSVGTTQLKATQGNSTQTNSMQFRDADSLREPPPVNPGQVFMGQYKSAYKAKYGSSPITGGKDSGIVKRMVRDYPIDRLCLWVQGYFQMPDKWFQTKGHDLATFEQNITKIQTAVDTGREKPGEESLTEIVARLDAHDAEKGRRLHGG